MEAIDFALRAVRRTGKAVRTGRPAHFFPLFSVRRSRY
jgi:hypothetical protein